MNDDDAYAGMFDEQVDEPEGTFDEKVERPADERDIPKDTLQIIRDGVKDGQRSGASAFWNVMMVLKRRGFTVDGPRRARPRNSA